MFLTKFSKNLIKKNIFNINTLKYSTNLKNHEEIDIDKIKNDFDSPVYQNILNQEDPFGVNKLVKMQDLFLSRCHFGHKSGTLNDYMKPFLFGVRQDITIFDLNITSKYLKKALNVAAHFAFRNAIILFIDSSKESAYVVEKAAIECGEYSNCRSFNQNSILKPHEYFKKSVRLPDLLIVFRTKKNNFEDHEAIKTAAKELIPTIAIVDSDCDPRLVTYPVPGNDDSFSSIELYSKLFKEAILLGKQKREELLKDD